VTFFPGKRLRAIKLAALERCLRETRTQTNESIQHRTLIDVLEPRLLFSADHPLGVAVGAADFQEHFEHLRDSQIAAVTLDMLHALERESSEDLTGSEDELIVTDEISENFVIENGSDADLDSLHDSIMVGFSIDDVNANVMLNDGVTPIIINVTTVDDRVDATDMSSFVAFNNGAGGDGLVSLREATIVANADDSVDIIRLPDGNYRLTLDGGNWNEDANLEGDLDLDGSFTIQGESEENTIIGQDVANQRVIEVREGPVTFSDLTISDGALGLQENGSGNSIPGGGLLVQQGDEAILNNVTFTNNESVGSGGALWVGGSVTLDNVTISGNEAVQGAGIYAGSQSTVVIKNSTIDNNRAGVDGGGIFSLGLMEIYDSVLEKNSANTGQASENTRGGAIWIGINGTATIQNTVFLENWAKSDGGAINNFGQLTLLDSELIGNNTEHTGGALRNAGNATLERVTVSGNTVTGSDEFDAGGGIFNAADGTMIISYSVIAENNSNSYAGGLKLEGVALVSDTIVISNSSKVINGGGGILSSGNTITLINSVVANNTAAEINNDFQGIENTADFVVNKFIVKLSGFNLVETAVNFDAKSTDIIGVDSGFTFSSAEGSNRSNISIDPTSPAINSGSSTGVGQTTINGATVGGTPNIGGHTSDLPGGMVFWSTDSNSIFRSDTNFTYTQKIIDGVANPLDIEVDDANYRVYWLDSDNHEIKSANFDGTNIVVERRVSVDAVAFALDIVDERFFIAAEAGDSSSIIQYLKSDTFSTEAEERAGALIQTISGKPTDIEHDQDSNILYWSEKTDGPEDIMSVETRPSGQDPQVPNPQIVANGSSLVENPYALAVNDAEDQVFWSEPDLGLVARYTTDSGSQTLNLAEAQALAYDSLNDRLLVADDSNNIYGINSTFDTVSASVSVSENVRDLSFALIQSDEPVPNKVPVITSLSNASVAENQSSVITVTSTDEDLDTPTYSIIGGTDIALFTIDSASGDLTFTSSPDFEAPGDTDVDNIYEVIVQVDDGYGGSDTQSIVVTVINSGETPILASAVSTNAAENQTSALTVSSSNVDGGAPVYTLTGGADAALFAIDGTSGDLKFQTAPDFEAPGDSDGDNVYELTVQVADADGDTATQSIAVTVTNENETPVITPMVSTTAVENQTSVLTVSSSNVDGSAPAYTITGGADAVLFAINRISGDLTFKTAPDFEVPGDSDKDNAYEATVQVEDADGDTAMQSIVVTVTDENEIPGMTPSVSTNTAENQTSVLTVSSSNVDGGAPVYTLNGGADAALFSIDSTSGELTFQTAPDFEAPGDTNENNVYEVTVRVEDADGDTATQSISVTVTDENETPLNTPMVATNAAENQTSVLTVSSSNVDGGAPVFTLTDGADFSSFAIDNTVGELTFKTAPDFEAPGDVDADNVYKVTVQVEDADGDTAMQSIVVTVTDENDTPVMTPTVSTNAAENQTSVLTVSSSNVDGGAPVYTLTGGADAALFAIDGTSGDLTFKTASDFEAPDDSDGDNAYEVTVQVEDTDGDTATQSITATVTDENETPVITPAVSTNAAENRTSVFTVGSSNVDGGAPVYTLSGGTDKALFAIDSTRGVLTFKVVPNFEAPIDADRDNVYEVSVQVVDIDGDTATQSIAVTVTDENETPEITPTVSANAAENQTSVLTVSSSHVDGGAPVYTLTGGADAALFAIDSTSGELVFQAAPDFEAPGDTDADNAYEVTVQVADIDGDISQQTILVSVTNVDESPKIAPNVKTYSAENQTYVLTVHSSDVDGGAPIYSINSGADAALFTIDPTSGVLKFQVAPDFEASLDSDNDNTYQLTVQVADDNNETDTQAIVVNVTDVDEIPVIDVLASPIIEENQTNVLTVNSSNVDGGAPAYSIVGGADAASLFIDGNSGSFMFQNAPDFEAPADVNADNAYEVIVQVNDGDDDSDRQAVTVGVSNVNEDPEILSANSITVVENQSIVLSVDGFDEDGDTPVYTISGGVDAALFAIDSLSGNITFQDNPDFELPRDAGEDNLHEITVQAIDGKGGADQQVITVNVRDDNDAPALSQQWVDQVIDLNSVITMGDGTFFDQDMDALEYSMTLSDGSSLPGWISFDPVTTDLRLGMVPTQAVSEELLLEAIDNKGGRAQMLFEVQFSPAVEIVEPTLQSANQETQTPPEISVPETEELNKGITLPKYSQQPTKVSDNGYSASDNSLISEDSVEAVASASAEIMPGSPSNGFSNIMGGEDGDIDRRAVLRDNILSEYLAEQADERVLSPEDHIKTDVFDDTVNIANLFAMAQQQNPEMYTSLSDSFDKQREEFESQISASRGVVGSAITATSGLSVGYILYLLRGGAIMSSMLSSLPAWRFVDPLPILGSLEGSLDSDGESLQSIVGDTGTSSVLKE